LFILAAGSTNGQDVEDSNDFILKGANELDTSGDAVAFGDFNGDGVDDLIIGAPGFDLSGRDGCGAIYVLIASDTLSASIDFSDTRPDLKRIFGPAPGSNIGRVITCGDVDNDGRDEIVCGLPGATPSAKGEVYVVFGSDTPADTIDLFAPPPGVTHIIGKESGQLGTSVAIGDVNNDTYGDIIAGAPWVMVGSLFAAGKAFVVYGSDAPADTIDLSAPTSSFTEILGEAQFQQLGTGCYSDDINGDLIDDIVTGAPQSSPLGRTDAGIAYIVAGSASMPDTIRTAEAPANGVVRIFGPSPAALVGSSFTSGSITPGIVPDLAVAAPLHSPLGRSGAGSVYIIEGTMTWPDTVDLADDGASATRVDGPGANLNIGLNHNRQPTLAAADLNMDGLDDLVIGVPKATPGAGRSEAGKAYLVFGRGEFPIPIDLAVLQNGVTEYWGDETDNNLGSSVAAGSMTASGFDDVLLGASGYTFRPGKIDQVLSLGRSYVVLGNPAITPTQVVFFDAAAHNGGVELLWMLSDDLDPQSMRVERRGDGSSRELDNRHIERSRPGQYTFYDSDVRRGGTYTYTVINENDRQLLFSIDVLTPGYPAARLHAGYPNPFRDHTTVGFDVPRPGRVMIRVYDVRGARVRTLADNRVPAGSSHVEWDGLNDRGRPAPTGIYFIQMDFQGITHKQKLVLLR
jgi:hypothetical protein